MKQRYEYEAMRRRFEARCWPRNAEIWALRLSGQTYARIGKRYNLSTGRIHQICERWKRANARGFY
jgi:Mor family transcriptional regulator